MAEKSNIAWCDSTFNPVIGCTEVSPACDNCYARTFVSGRMGKPELWKGERYRTSAANWRKPLAWDRKAAKLGVRYRVFCASLADVFDNQWLPEWRADLWTLIRATPNLDWLLLTKRPQNIRKMLPADWGEGWPNVWLGTTVENQAEADRRIHHLLAVPAVVHFLSCEPLLEYVDLAIFWRKYELNANRWIICGGESGSKFRQMDPKWARSVRDRCKASGVAFFMKQMSGNTKAALEAIPADLMIREYPR